MKALGTARIQGGLIGDRLRVPRAHRINEGYAHSFKRMAHRHIRAFAARLEDSIARSFGDSYVNRSTRYVGSGDPVKLPSGRRSEI